MRSVLWVRVASPASAYTNVGSLRDPTSQHWLGGPRQGTAPADKKAGHYVDQGQVRLGRCRPAERHAVADRQAVLRRGSKLPRLGTAEEHHVGQPPRWRHELHPFD